jgi:magnesium transporter
MSAALDLVRAFAAENPEEVARHLERSPSAAGAEVLGALSPESAAKVLGNTVPLAAAAALCALEPERGAGILELCEPPLAAAILLRMPKTERARFLDALSPARAQHMKTMTDYGPRLAGGRIDARAPALPEATTVAEAFEHIRRFPAGALHYVYSVDAEGRLTGVVSMRELMLAAPETPIGSIVTRDPEALFAEDPLEVVVRHAGWKRSHALPVVSRDRRFLGVLRYSTFRAIETELGQAASGPDADQTASALAELCALGTSAMTRFIGSALSLEPWAEAAERTPLPPPSSRRSVLPGGL